MAIDLNVVKEAFKDSYLKDCFSVMDGNAIYFRRDTEDSDSRQQWDNYIDVCDELRSKGYKFIEPQIEHDCITGDVVQNGTE